MKYNFHAGVQWLGSTTLRLDVRERNLRPKIREVQPPGWRQGKYSLQTRCDGDAIYRLEVRCTASRLEMSVHSLEARDEGAQPPG